MKQNMGHPESTEQTNPKYMPELGCLISVNLQEVPRFKRFVLSTKHLLTRYSHGNYVASLYRYPRGLTASL